MPILASLIEPIAAIIDKIIPDKAARDKAKLELLELQGTQELQQIQTQLSAIVAEANSRDREAEIRAKNAEGFVAGIQAELARQGVIIPGGVAQVKPPRGR